MLQADVRQWRTVFVFVSNITPFIYNHAYQKPGTMFSPLLFPLYFSRDSLIEENSQLHPQRTWILVHSLELADLIQDTKVYQCGVYLRHLAHGHCTCSCTSENANSAFG